MAVHHRRTPLWVTSDVLIAADSQHRVTLTSAGRTFTFGPTNACSANAAGAAACLDFTADPGNKISFAKTRSALAWPAPFEFSLMGAPVTAWRRHACDRLRWKKASGAQLDRVWRDEQGFHAEVGWTDGHLQIAPVVTTAPSPFTATRSASNARAETPTPAPSPTPKSTDNAT